MSRGTLYVGCGLTAAPAEFIAEVTDFKDVLRQEDYHVFDFIGLVNGTNEEVYNFDSNCVTSCDVFVPILDYPSTGLGIEMGDAKHAQIPTLAVAHRDAKVTRMALGMTEVEPTMSFLRYERLRDVVPAIGELMLKTQIHR